MLFPDLAEEYGHEKKVNVHILNEVRKDDIDGTFGIIKKDMIELNIAFPILIKVQLDPSQEKTNLMKRELDDSNWKQVRQGHIKVKISFKLKNDDSSHFLIAPSAMIKEINLINPETEE